MSSRFTLPKSTQLHHTEDKPGIAPAGWPAGPRVINSSVGFKICHEFAEALGNRCNLSNLHCSTTLRTSNTLGNNFNIYRKNSLKPSQVPCIFCSFHPTTASLQTLFLLFQCSPSCHCQSLHPSEFFQLLPYLVVALQILPRLA